MNLGNLVRRAVSMFLRSKSRSRPTRRPATRTRGGSTEAQIASGVAKMAKKKL